MPYPPLKHMISTTAGALILTFSAAGFAADTDSLSTPQPEARTPRISVAADSGTETDIRDCLSNAVEAANAENLDAFCDCFTGPARSKLRKQAAIRFVQHNVAMELLDTQVIKAGKTSGELAVKYRLVLSDDRYEVVSLVAVKRENGYWRIDMERIRSYEHQSPRMCSPSRYACLGGTCQVAARR